MVPRAMKWFGASWGAAVCREADRIVKKLEI
jgi:hypothetical protein